MTNDLRIADAPLLVDVSGEEKLPTGGYGNYSTTINQIADFTQLKWKLATEGYVNNEINVVTNKLNIHTQDKTNPHGVTKEQVGLGEVDNTADLDKPISVYQQSAIDEKIAKTNIVDNLTNNDSTKVLSAKQGKVLQDTKANKADVYTKSETLTLEREDKYLITESGRTQRAKNNEVKSILDFGGFEGETCPRLSEKFTTLDDAKSAYPDIADKITTLDLYVNDVALFLSKADGCKAIKLPHGVFKCLDNYSIPVDIACYSNGQAYIQFDNYYWIRRWDGETQKLTVHVYFEQSNVTTLVNGNQEPITWIAPNTFTVTSTEPKGNLPWRIDIKNARVPIGGTISYPVLQTYLSFPPRYAQFSYDLSGNYGRTSGKGGNNTGYGASTLENLTTGGNNTAIGYASGASLTTLENQTFMGFQCGHRLVNGQGNTAMGSIALEHLTDGEWNVAIGFNAQGSKIKGSNNVSLGAETLWSWGECNNNTAIGHRALANSGASGENNVAVGTFSQDFGGGNSNTSMGYRALCGSTGTYGFLTGGDNVVTGAFACRYLGGTSARNTVYGTSALLNAQQINDTTAIGYQALLKHLSGEGVTAIGVKSQYESTSGRRNTSVGYQTLLNNVLGIDCTAIGYESLLKATGNENTALGIWSGRDLASGIGNTFVGSRAGATETGNNNTHVGRSASSGAVSSTGVTSVGALANQTLTDGTTLPTNLTNATILGYSASVSGSNQVQLGNSATTTYVYGTVQNRSDERDKADIRDTELGLPFINSLRPVDYKLDMREDYIETLEDGTVIKHERDGSKKRERYHHGFIAQEVPEGFGGYQDHKINGGSDVLSLGYDEFIAPMVKAIQELSKEVEFLKKQLESK